MCGQKLVSCHKVKMYHNFRPVSMHNPLQRIGFRLRQQPEAALLVGYGLVVLLLVVLAGTLLLPVFVALVLAYLLERPVQWLQTIGLSRTAAVCAAMLLLVLLLWWLTASLVPLLWSQGQAFASAVPALIASGQSSLAQWSADWFSERQLLLLTQRLESQSLGYLNTLLASSLDGVAGVFMALVYLVLLPMMLFFMLKDKTLLLCHMHRLFPGTGQRTSEAWRELDYQLLGYIQGKLLEMVLLALACYLLFSLSALPYALLLAMLVGVSVFVPYIGIAVVTVPVLLVTLSQWGLSSETGWFLFSYGLIQLLDAYVLVPLLFSRVIDIHPFYILLALLVFGGLFGFWGLFFAIPLASLLKVLLHTWWPANE